MCRVLLGGRQHLVGWPCCCCCWPCCAAHPLHQSACLNTGCWLPSAGFLQVAERLQEAIKGLHALVGELRT